MNDLDTDHKLLAKLPDNYLVLNLFQNTPTQKHFFVLGKDLNKKDMYGIFYFDGISNTPTSYETFWQNEHMLSKIMN